MIMTGLDSVVSVHEKKWVWTDANHAICYSHISNMKIDPNDAGLYMQCGTKTDQWACPKLMVFASP